MTVPSTYYLIVVGFDGEDTLIDSLNKHAEIVINVKPHRLVADLDLTKIPPNVERIRFIVEDREDATGD